MGIEERLRKNAAIDRSANELLQAFKEGGRRDEASRREAVNRRKEILSLTASLTNQGFKVNPSQVESFIAVPEKPTLFDQGLVALGLKEAPIVQPQVTAGDLLGERTTEFQQKEQDEVNRRELTSLRVKELSQRTNPDFKAEQLQRTENIRVKSQARKQESKLRKELNKKKVDIDTGTALLDEILKGAERQPTLGFVKGVTESIKESVGLQDPQFARFSTKLKANISEVIKLFSGTAASEAEQKRIASFSPSESDGIEQIKAKILGLKDFAAVKKRILKRRLPKEDQDELIDKELSIIQKQAGVSEAPKTFTSNRSFPPNSIIQNAEGVKFSVGEDGVTLTEVK